MKVFFRLIASLVLFLLLVYVPWWMFSAGLFLAIVFLPRYFEGLIFAGLADIFYSVYPSFYFTAIFFTIFLLLELFLKERLRSPQNYV